MNCFEGLVGLRGVEATADMWVNDLAGISTELAYDLKDADSQDLASFWQTIKDRAFNYLRNQVTTKLSQVYLSNGNEVVRKINEQANAIFCNSLTNKRLLSLAWQNLLALELIKEKIYSNNINYFTTTNLDKTKELAGLLLNDYESALKNALPSLQLPSEWLLCDRGEVNFTYILP